MSDLADKIRELPMQLTVEQVTAALDKAIGAVIDPVPDCVPRGIMRKIQMEKLTEELNRALASSREAVLGVVAAGIAEPEPHGGHNGCRKFSCSCGELFDNYELWKDHSIEAQKALKPQP